MHKFFHLYESVKIDPTFCFFVSPFSKYKKFQKDIIQPVCDKFGIRTVRADDIFHTKQVLNEIFESIMKSRFIIAEISDLNANVYYEVGLAHALDKPIILLTRDAKKLPFDFKTTNCLIYKNNVDGIGELTQGLENFIERILAEPVSRNILISPGDLLIPKYALDEAAAVLNDFYAFNAQLHSRRKQRVEKLIAKAQQVKFSYDNSQISLIDAKGVIVYHQGQNLIGTNINEWLFDFCNRPVFQTVLDMERGEIDWYDKTTSGKDKSKTFDSRYIRYNIARYYKIPKANLFTVVEIHKEVF